MSSSIDKSWLPAVLLAILLGSATAAWAANPLEAELGRNEVRVYSAPFTLPVGGTVTGVDLPARLDRLGYRRVRARPEASGEYFWGHETFWIHRRPYDAAGKSWPGRLLKLELRRKDGRILAVTDADGASLALGALEPGAASLEPELLAESLENERALRLPVYLDQLPERVWRSVLAAEDSRFFEHSGLDARSLARAAYKNARAGQVVQGGSTITQQLVKVRDLSPKRSLGRKASEAVRALALEAAYDKRDILEAYLNAVYFGHLEGRALHGLGTAAAAYFAKPATELDLAEAALLAGIIQGPNRLHPVRHPAACLERQRWVLSRMEALGWATPAEAEAARRRGLPHLRPTPPAPPARRQFLSWIRQEVAEKAPKRVDERRGVVADTSLDPLLQSHAEFVVLSGLQRLRSRQPGLARRPLSAALVTLDGNTGEVLAYVGGDPGDTGDAFDRARKARRQPGSAVKPLVLLESFGRCAGRRPLYPARRIVDRPLTLELESGPWTPSNPDGSFRGTVTIRDALVSSLNVPFVRIARYCGFQETAGRVRRAGLALPDPAPPSFVLGAVETTPLALAAAYTTFVTPGRRVEPRPILRLGRPGGGKIARPGRRSHRVVIDDAAWMVRSLLEEAVKRGTAGGGALENAVAFGKTGTSSERRDAWYAGGAGALVTVVWVGLDDGSSLGLSGAAAAAPIWRDFMSGAVALHPTIGPERPPGVVERWVDDRGRIVADGKSGAEPYLFRKRAVPRRRAWYLKDPPVAPLE